MWTKVVVTFLRCFVFILAASANTANSIGCTFNVTNNETEKNLPVPLYNISSDYEFAIPQQGLIHLKAEQNISLLCSGTRNYVRQTNSNVTTVKCIENDDVKLYRDVLKFEQIQCKNIVKGDVRPTDEKCGNNQGVIYQIGYPVTRKDWITLITVCYQPVIGNTLYTRHVIHGKDIQYASKNRYRPGFSTAGQYENITASLAYKQAFQKATFSSILGSSELASQFINDKSFLARGHLSPDADFLLATAQFSTYYYVNAVPQWQSINGASWKSIEFTVRELSAHYGDLDVLTGTYSILSYNDKDNNPKDIYLGENQILPVPKYLWKVAYEPKTRKAIVFVILNDPFIKSPKEQAFCKDICEENGLNKKMSSWKKPTSGYVFCCSFGDFRDTVKTAPELSVSGVLTDPVLDVSLKILSLNDVV